VSLTLDTQEALKCLKGAQYLSQPAVLLADLTSISSAGNIGKQNHFLVDKRFGYSKLISIPEYGRSDPLC
jgi:hypothetical protein